MGLLDEVVAAFLLSFLCGGNLLRRCVGLLLQRKHLKVKTRYDTPQGIKVKHSLASRWPPRTF